MAVTCKCSMLELERTESVRSRLLCLRTHGRVQMENDSYSVDWPTVSSPLIMPVARHTSPDTTCCERSSEPAYAWAYFCAFMGVEQLGKKVLATILAACPLVTLALGLK